MRCKASSKELESNACSVPVLGVLVLRTVPQPVCPRLNATQMILQIIEINPERFRASMPSPAPLHLETERQQATESSPSDSASQQLMRHYHGL